MDKIRSMLLFTALCAWSRKHTNYHNFLILTFNENFITKFEKNKQSYNEDDVYLCYSWEGMVLYKLVQMD